MTAKVIACANQKGGSGKTTLAMQLAGTLGLQGVRVLVVDADPQASAQRWNSAAPDEKPFPATVIGLADAGEKVHREVGKHVGVYDYIVIDCPPAVESAATQSALMVADLVLIPIIPSPTDLWAAAGIRKLIENVKDTINESLEARLVPNMVQSNTMITRDVLDLLTSFGIELLGAQLHLRTAYRQAAALGCVVATLGSDAHAANDEINTLTGRVLQLLELRAHAKKANQN
jgi:chromosome partitioning protein